MGFKPSVTTSKHMDRAFKTRKHENTSRERGRSNGKGIKKPETMKLKFKLVLRGLGAGVGLNSGNDLGGAVHVMSSGLLNG